MMAPGVNSGGHYFFLIVFPLLLSDGKLLITPNNAYIGPSKKSLVYSHPTDKQCSYEPDLSNINAATLQGYTYDQIISNAGLSTVRIQNSSIAATFNGSNSSISYSGTNVISSSAFNYDALLFTISAAFPSRTHSDDAGRGCFFSIHLPNYATDVKADYTRISSASSSYMKLSTVVNSTKERFFLGESDRFVHLSQDSCTFDASTRLFTLSVYNMDQNASVTISYTVYGVKFFNV